MNSVPKVSMSNDYRVLVEKLKSQLYSPSHKFTRKLLITPCDSVKLKIEKAFLRDERTAVFFGVRHVNLHLAMQEILTFLRPEVKFPTPNQIAAFIENEIRQDVDSHFKALLDEIGRNDVAIFKLSDHLSSLFFEYGIFMPESFLKEEGWQNELFRRVFSYFDLPSKAFKIVPRGDKVRWQLFFFGLQTLPQIYLDFLEKASGSVESYFYLFSYSHYYFLDYLSSKERLRIMRMDPSEEIETYLDMHNPLFSNLCSLARPLMVSILDRGYHVDEEYIEKETGSLLKNLQSDLFELVNPLDIAKMKVETTDVSIRVFEASSRLREVEKVRDQILYAIEKEEASLGDIAVFAPDIVAYAPFIEYAFSEEKSPVGYSIEGVKGSFGLVSSLLERLLSLFTSRWDAAEIAELLESPIIQNKFGFSLSEAQKFAFWLDKTNMVWGFDEEHRKEFVDSDVAGLAGGTLRNSFTKICLGLCALDPGSLTPPFYSPIEIDLPLSLSVGKIMDFLNSLYALIKKIKEEARPIKEHLSLFSLLFDFALPPFGLKEESASFEQFSQKVTKMFQGLHFLKEAKFPASSLLPPIKRLLLGKKGTARSKSRKRIRFASFDLGESFNEGFVVCMGMSEGAFPRVTPISSFDELLRKKVRHRAPFMQEIDRYIFLELLMSVKNRILFSYSKRGDLGGGETLSFLVSDLLSYLSERTLLPKEHFIEVVSDFNLSLDSLSCCYDPFFQEMGVYYHEKRDAVKEPLYRKVVQEPLKKIDIASLFRVAKNPLQYFCKESMGFSFAREIEEEPFEKEFVVSPLEGGLLRHQWAKKQGDILKFQYLSNAPFFSLLHQSHGALEVDQEFEKLEESLTLFGLKKDGIFSICFTPFAEKMGPYEHPPLTIELKSGERVQLVGTLPSLSKEGMVSMQKGRFENLYTLWPYILIYNQLDLPKQLILLREQKKISCSVENAKEALRDFVEFSILASKEPIVALPNLLEDLLKGNFKAFLAEIEEEKDLHVKWLFGSEEGGALSQINIEEMQKKACAFLSPFLNWMAPDARV